MGLLNIGASALNAAYTQIQTTGNNISNANTPGYHRQTVSQSDSSYYGVGKSFVGTGVQVDGVRRQYDQFLDARVSSTQSAASADSARDTQMTALQTLFSDNTTSVSGAMNDLRSSLADLSASPSDSSVRTVVLSRASTVAQRFNDTSAQIDSLATDTDNQIGTQVTQLNSLLTQVASLNNKIAVSSQGGTGTAASDLLDQRDSLITQVNQIARGVAYINADGTASLMTSGGQPLVVGSQASKFSVGKDPLGSGQPRLQLDAGTGGVVTLPDATIGGGSLSGLLQFRNDDLAAAKTRLGQLAVGVATAFNQAQASGVDLNGASGQPMFATDAPLVAAGSINTGSGSVAVTVADPTKLAASDYQVGFDGTQYNVTRLSDGTKTALTSSPQVIDGLSFNVGGAPNAGDSFNVASASTFASNFSMTLSSPDQLAVGVAMTPQVPTSNTGSVAVSKFAVTTPGDANATQPVTLTFAGDGTYSISGAGTGDATGVPYTSGQPITYNGWSMTLAGTPAAGDTITLTPTTSPATDNRNAQGLLSAVDATTVGGSSFTDAYANMVADVGSRAQSASTSSDASTAALNSATQARDSVSGVNLDEEAARLLQFQQAYQAAAKLISTSQAMFTSFLNAVGG